MNRIVIIIIIIIINRTRLDVIFFLSVNVLYTYYMDIFKFLHAARVNYYGYI